jgi:hypothetical protein
MISNRLPIFKAFVIAPRIVLMTFSESRIESFSLPPSSTINSDLLWRYSLMMKQESSTKQ